MDNKDVLIKILEELKIGEDGFMTSLIHGELVRATIFMVISLIILFILISLFKIFNRIFCIKDNVKEIVSILQNKCKNKTIDDTKSNENIEADTEEKVEEIATENRDNEYSSYELQDLVNSIKAFFQRNTTWRYTITILLVWTEFKWILNLAKSIINNLIIIINCFCAPEKILIDYLGNLFH